MYGLKRRALAAFLAGGLLLSGIPAPAFAASIYEKIENETIANGVTYQRILRFGDQGWVNVNVVRKDLKNPNSRLELASSANGVSTRETVASMVKRVENPVAAINADFFYMMKPDSPLGVMVKDGQLISSPVLVKPYNVLTVLKDGQASFGPWTLNMRIANGNGLEFPVQAFNKITWNYRMMTVLDRNWGPMTPGAAEDYPDLVEVIVADGVIREIRQGLPATAIPENGFVVLASDAQGQLLAQNFRQGDELSFDAGNGISGVDVAVGGGTLLVRNGQITPFIEPVNGTSSRTALGTNAAGDQLIMATVDGRHSSYRGMDNQQMAALMLELGAYNAMMLDGGGSTTMVKRDLGEGQPRLVTYASDGSLRPVINSLVVTAGAPTGELAGIVVKAGQESVFSGSSVALAVTGYDTAYNPMAVTSSSVKYTVVEGKGRIENGRLIPLAQGNIVVQAEYQGKQAAKSLKVLSNLAGIELEAARNTLNPGETTTLTVTGIDAGGYRAFLDPSSVRFSDDNRLGTIQNGTFAAGQLEGTTVVRASFGGYGAAVPVAIGSQRVALGTLANFAPGFIGYPAAVTGSVTVKPMGQGKEGAVQLDYDFTGSTETTAAYVALGNGGIPLTARPQKIGISVFADQTSPHWIRGQIKDRNGNTQTIEFKQGVDWLGWKRLEAVVPSTLGIPATLERIYVVEPTAYKTRGSLMFDGLELMNPLTLPVLAPNERGGVLQDPLNRKPTDYEQKWLVYGGSSQADRQAMLQNTLAAGYDMALLTGPYDAAALSQTGKAVGATSAGYATAQREDELLIFLNNSGDGLRRTDYSQWPWLQNLLRSNTKKNVLVFMQKPIWGSGGFSDKLEANLLGDQLTALAERGTNVYVFYGGGTASIETRNGVRYLGTGKEMDQYISLYKKNGQILYNVEKFNINR